MSYVMDKSFIHIGIYEKKNFRKISGISLQKAVVCASKSFVTFKIREIITLE
jgi:hypothetical protein